MHACIIIIIIANTVPPNQAHALMVESSESTTISITWQPPTLNSLHVLYYIINANNVNSTTRIDGITQVNTTNNATSFNMTGLLPGTTYKLTVEAAFEENTNTIFVSQPSSFVTATTGFTGINLINLRYGHSFINFVVFICYPFFWCTSSIELSVTLWLEQLKLCRDQCASHVNLANLVTLK